jgi:hypothetical protein
MMLQSNFTSQAILVNQDKATELALDEKRITWRVGRPVRAATPIGNFHCGRQGAASNNVYPTHSADQNIVSLFILVSKQFAPRFPPWCIRSLRWHLRNCVMAALPWEDLGV